MKVVYLLSEELKTNPDRITRAQALTLNASKPLLGLKGSNGLFGSPEWWDSIKQGRISLKYVSGEIIRTYIAGQDSLPTDNGFTLLLKNGITYDGCNDYVKNIDKKLFKIGATVQMVYALDELKKPKSTGEKDYLNILLEMAVSVDTV